VKVKFHQSVPSVEKMAEVHNMTIGTAVEVGDLVLLSGFVNADLETGALPDVGIEESSRGALQVVEAVLADLDLSLDHVIKITSYLVDAADFPGWSMVFNETFKAPRPLRTTVMAGLLAGKVELDVIAARQPRPVA
jgi:2-iminobutanoate/2-iminopropanoate deaminase